MNKAPIERSGPFWRRGSRASSLREDVARLNVSHAIIDAECCCDGKNGVPDFEPYAYAFDLLAIDGDDTRKLPLLERKAALAKLLRKAKPGIRYSEHLAGDGRVVRSSLKLGLEGIVSKRLNSPYRSGKSKSWLKLKNPKAP